MHNHLDQYQERLGNEELDLRTIENDIIATDRWDKLFAIGNFIFEQESGNADRLIMDAYEKAFRCGLNIRANRESYLIAVKQLIKVYFQFRKYDEAINMLLVLDSYVDQLPDWANLYYVAAQIHTENILYWAENPKALFSHIDNIDEADIESVKKRKFLFLEFLKRLTEISTNKNLYNVDSSSIISKASLLGIEESPECINFKIALGIIEKAPQKADKQQQEEVISSKIKVQAYEEILASLHAQIEELQEKINALNNQLSQQRIETSNKEKQLFIAQQEKEAIEIQYKKQSNALRTVKEHECVLLEKCCTLERTISGKATVDKQLEENALLIGKLEADNEHLKLELDIAHKRNDSIHAENEQYKNTIDELQRKLLNQETIEHELRNSISSLKSQIKAAKTSESERLEKSKAASEVTTCETYLKKNEATDHDLHMVSRELLRHQKILIIGGSEVKESHLRGRLKAMGFDFSKEQLEFLLEYDDIKTYTSRLSQFSGRYAGIIVGPCPHKAKDTDGYSSFIQKIKTEEGYPHVEEARDKSGTLKITKDSLGEAMRNMSIYLHIAS